MIWGDAVLQAVHRLSDRHNTRIITRQQLIREELEQIVQDTRSRGITPEQTLSRVLQELGREEILYLFGDGSYLLLDTPLHIETEDLPDNVIDFALKRNKLHIGIIHTSEEQAITRQRRGQARVRELTLRNYANRCAFCDVTDIKLLVASHISRWADDPGARGNLSNVACLCRLHDPLFEYGYLALSDNYEILKRKHVKSQFIGLTLKLTDEFRLPTSPPASEFLRKHRIRTGFEEQV